MISTFSSINGKIVENSAATIGVMDLSVQRGYGIFDYFKILAGVPVFLDDHILRFFASADQMRLKLRSNETEIRQMIIDLAEKNKMPVSGIKLTLTGGYSTDGFSLGEPNLVMTQSDLPAYKDVNENGIHLITWQHQRQMPTVKTIDYLMAVWLQPIIKEKNAQDVLYISNDLLTECPRSNVFIVTNENEILTPANNVLPGITRKQLLSLSGEFNIRAADISTEQLKSAKEVFITSSTKNILPVLNIDGQDVHNGTIGEQTKILATRLAELIRTNIGSMK